MEQAISWKGISELRKMKNSYDLLHNCDDDDGWLRKKRCLNLKNDSNNKNKKNINYNEDDDN